MIYSNSISLILTHLNFIDIMSMTLIEQDSRHSLIYIEMIWHRASITQFCKFFTSTQMSMIKVKECPVYHVSPSKAQPNSPPHALILLQEWWGLNSQMKNISHRFSTSLPAFHILTPDLYHGKTAHTEDEASHLYHDLDWDGAVRDVQACADHARNDLGCQTVFTLGFCMGGALTIASAARVNGLTAGN